MRLRIATLNVWGLPFGLARDLPERRSAIGASLAGLDVEAVAFQEVWTAATLAALREAGHSAGLVHAWPAAGDTAPGGLLLLSRLPFGAGRFEAYAARGLPERIWHGDYQGGKGFASVRLQTPEGPVGLFATHLVSQYAPDREDVYWGQRMAQVVQLATALRAWPDPVVAVGDFNLSDDQPHHGALLGLAGLRDAALERGRREPTVLPSNPYRSSRRAPDARIDYVFVRAGAERGLRTLGFERVFDEPLRLGGRKAAYSDHAGLRVELAVDRTTAGGETPAADPGAVETARRLLVGGRSAAEQRRFRRRALGGLGLTAAALAFLGQRGGGLSRRRMLRGLLGSGGALMGLSGLGALALAELASPDETAAFDRALRELESL